MPEFSWKFSNGAGSKTWTVLTEDSYPRMMEAAAKRIRAWARKESGLKDPDLGSGWWIDLKLENSVDVIKEQWPNNEQWEESLKEAEKGKKKKKKSKGKVLGKQKRGGPKKVCFHIRSFPQLTLG